MSQKRGQKRVLHTGREQRQTWRCAGSGLHTCQLRYFQVETGSKTGDSAECDIETDIVCYCGRHLHRHRLRHMEIERGVAEA